MKQQETKLLWEAVNKINERQTAFADGLKIHHDGWQLLKEIVEKQDVTIREMEARVKSLEQIIAPMRQALEKLGAAVMGHHVLFEAMTAVPGRKLRELN